MPGMGRPGGDGWSARAAKGAEKPGDGRGLVTTAQTVMRPPQSGQSFTSTSRLRRSGVAQARLATARARSRSAADRPRLRPRRRRRPGRGRGSGHARRGSPRAVHPASPRPSARTSSRARRAWPTAGNDDEAPPRTCASARRTSRRVATRPDSSYGNASTYCRTGAAGSMQSTRCATVPAIRRPAQLGHRSRSLHEKVTAMSLRYAAHRTWTKPREKSAHARYFRNSSFTYFGSGPSYASRACRKKSSRCSCTNPKSTPYCGRRGA